MIELEQVQPRDLTDEDIRWMVMGCMESYDGVSVKELVQSALEGWTGIYRLGGDTEGVVTLSDKLLGQRHGFEITCLAGRHVLSHLDEINKAVCTVARAAGGEFVMGYVAKAPLAEMYRRKTRAREVARVFVEDLV